MISLLEACSICMGKKTNYMVSAVYDFGDLWKITVRPKEDPCDPFSIYPFLVRKSDGALCGYFPPTHADDYCNSKGVQIDPPEKYR